MECGLARGTWAVKICKVFPLIIAKLWAEFWGPAEAKRGRKMSFSGDKIGMTGASNQWFHRNIGRMETEKLLVENREDGSFLIRESDTVKGAYVLSTM